MSEKLELTSPQNAETEKRLASHAKNVRAYASGVRRSGAQMFGYAFLAGREMNLAAEVLPHGELGKWLKNSFPDISKGTSDNWRAFAKAAESKFPTVGNLKLLSLKKTFSKKEQSTILETIPSVMDDQGMIDFTRACGFSKIPKLSGGEKIDPAKVKQWCQQYHPDMPLEKCELLPGKLKSEYRKWAAQEAIRAAKFTESAHVGIFANHVNNLQAMIADESTVKKLTVAELKQWIELKDALGRKLRDELALRKES